MTESTSARHSLGRPSPGSEQRGQRGDQLAPRSFPGHQQEISQRHQRQSERQECLPADERRPKRAPEGGHQTASTGGRPQENAAWRQPQQDQQQHPFRNCPPLQQEKKNWPGVDFLLVVWFFGARGLLYLHFCRLIFNFRLPSFYFLFTFSFRFFSCNCPFWKI